MYPTLSIALGSFDFVIVWKLISKRTLQAFHYTFLVVFVISFVYMANSVATEQFHPLGDLVRWYPQMAGQNANRVAIGYMKIGEIWTSALLSLVLACLTGMVAAWLEKDIGWDIAAVWRGCLVG